MKKQSKLLRRLLVLIMAAALMLPSVPAFASAAEKQEGYYDELYGVMTVVNCKSWTSLRKKPDTSSERLEKVPLGAVVTNCWYENEKYTYCEYEGVSGYILSKNLALVSGPEGKELPVRNYQGNMEIVNCSSYASLRKKADTKSDLVVKIPLGSIVTNVFSVDDKFSWCIFDGQEGYVLNSNLAWVSGGLEGLIPEEDWIGDCVIINCSSYASLRKDPDTSSDRLAKVPLGETVTDCYYVDDKFACCTYEGQTGYILISNLGQ